jgi:hypothetical protein
MRQVPNFRLYISGSGGFEYVTIIWRRQQDRMSPGLQPFEDIQEAQFRTANMGARV